MRRPIHNTAKLPRRLLDELGVAEGTNVGRNKRTGPAVRKERRKVARIQKKAKNLPSKSVSLQKGLKQQSNTRKYSGSDESSSPTEEHQSSAVAGPLKYHKPILKPARPSSGPDSKHETRAPRPHSPTPRIRVSQGTKDRLAADDEEIRALERALGVKGKNKLPKAFEEDGLNELLSGLDDTGLSEEASLGKRKRAEGDEWLERKRQKALKLYQATDEIAAEDTSSAEVIAAEEGNLSDDDLENEEDSMDEDEDEAISFEEPDEGLSSPHATTRKVRENPYVAPVAPSDGTAPYNSVPPVLRDANGTQVEEISRLRRKIQGLLNRTSEANLVSILGEIEKLYRDNPRQHVSTTLLDLLLGLLCDSTSLQDTFIILHAGFIASIYKIIGMDFGAQAVQRILEQFNKSYKSEAGGDSKAKRSMNLTSLLSELYNFQVIGSNLIYDFIRLFLEELTETNAELLLRIMRSSGLQLRQDDPSSLRDIVVLLQQAIEKAGHTNLSVRTKFMIESIYNIKNNRVKTGIAASTVTSEHTVRMKKILGSLNARNIKASEPLRIGLKDIQETDKRGKWWLIGASYKDEVRDSGEQIINIPSSTTNGGKEARTLDSAAADLIALAKEQCMNTDVRRSIFIAIMSATDYNDAYVRLQKLGLKKKQEQEIPKVLVHCSGAEKLYNPFYTLLARRVCSDRKLRMGFQLSLWELFRRMGEGEDDNKEDDDSDAEDTLSLRYLVNLAKMFGTLVAEGGLGLGILKMLNFAYLQTKTRTFVELMLITVFLELRGDRGGGKAEAPIIEVFLGPKEAPIMARGLQYFLKMVVSKTDVAGTEQDKETVKWGCKVAGDALKAIVSGTIEGE